MTALDHPVTPSATAPPQAPRRALVVPEEWNGPAHPDLGRDVALDLLRGLAMAVLVINHLPPESFLEEVTRLLLSAAEVLVGISGVVVGMVFGRRWLQRGARAVTRQLLERARTLWLASVVVVTGAWLAGLVPGVAGEVVRFSPRAPDRDLYGFDSAPEATLQILTLKAGPWQFNILGLFIALLVLAPLILRALEHGRWPWVLAGSWALYLLARAEPIAVLPSQSERPFPLLIWQALFVTGVVVGWHRGHLVAAARRHRHAARVAAASVVVTAAALALTQLPSIGLDPLRALGLAPPDWAAWEAENYRKRWLDPLRILALTCFAGTAYLAFARWSRGAARLLGWALLPLGRNSFYVFIVHVPLCLAVASVPGLTGLGLLGNALLQLALLAGLVAAVRRELLFRWIPR